jgi:7-cyano-7-deazaguanine synthase in queuosine biosynthesis
MKNIIVMSSGGFDSTYLIWKNLEEGNKVFPVYIETTIDPEQKKAEINALNIICHYFSDIYGFSMINCWPERLELNVTYAKGIPLQQSQVWIYGAFLFSQKEQKNFDEVQIGYIMNDCALSYLDELKNLWNAFNLFKHDASNKTPNLSFPIIKKLKFDIMNVLSEKCPEIFSFVHFCERPKEKENCKECPSCKKAYSSEYERLSARAEGNKKYIPCFANKKGEVLIQGVTDKKTELILTKRK